MTLRKYWWEKLLTEIQINKPSQAQARGNGQFARCIYGAMLLSADIETPCLDMASSCTLSDLTGGLGPYDPQLLIPQTERKHFVRLTKHPLAAQHSTAQHTGVCQSSIKNTNWRTCNRNKECFEVWGLHKEVSFLEGNNITRMRHLFPWLLISWHLDLWGVCLSKLPSLLGRWRDLYKGSFCAQQKDEWNPSWTAPREAEFPHHSVAHWANV